MGLGHAAAAFGPARGMTAEVFMDVVRLPAHRRAAFGFLCALFIGIGCVPLPRVFAGAPGRAPDVPLAAASKDDEDADAGRLDVEGRSGRAAARDGIASRTKGIGYAKRSKERKKGKTEKKEGRASATRYLIVGGGTSPFDTQVSIEEHIRRAAGIVEAQGRRSRAIVLFGPGEGRTPAVKLAEHPGHEDDLADLLARILEFDRDRGMTWRPTEIPDLDGPSTKEKLRALMTAPGESGRTLLYLAGHGFRSRRRGAVSVGLWDRARISPLDLSRWLDKLGDNYQFVAIMTQCYGGAFGRILFEHADEGAALVGADRCAFFAAPPDFVASGCTPEAGRRHPDDYSTWFLGAIEGRRSDGGPLPSDPDLDRDGRVSLDEAHGFARLYDGTLDVPTSSSEYVIRALAERFEPLEGVDLGLPYGELVGRARPVERRVIEGLAERLGVRGDSAAPLEARYHADRLWAERERLEDRLDEVEERWDESRQAIEEALLDRWPWLKNPLHPHFGRVLEADGEAIADFIRTHEAYRDLESASGEAGDLRARIRALERAWAPWERLARAMETIVLEARVRARGSPDEIRRLDAILACEGGTW